MATKSADYFKLPKSVQQVADEIIKATSPRQLILFGSRARGDQRENSDFDFAVDLRQCSEDSWNRLIVDIEEEPWCLYKIDLVELEKMGMDYRLEIEKDGILIYG